MESHKQQYCNLARPVVFSWPNRQTAASLGIVSQIVCCPLSIIQLSSFVGLAVSAIGESFQCCVCSLDVHHCLLSRIYDYVAIRLGLGSKGTRAAANTQARYSARRMTTAGCFVFSFAAISFVYSPIGQRALSLGAVAEYDDSCFFPAFGGGDAQGTALKLSICRRTLGSWFLSAPRAAQPHVPQRRSGTRTTILL